MPASLFDEEQSMRSHVIQFGELETFTAEPLGHNNVVRVVVLEISEGVSSQIPDLRQVSVGVHVRTISDSGCILACYLPVATVQLFNGRREGDPTWQQYDAVWEKAEALKERVIVFLQEAAVQKGFTVCAAGVIDIGQIRPLRAAWQSDPILVAQS
jgi:hypothetical protein